MIPPDRYARAFPGDERQGGIAFSSPRSEVFADKFRAVIHPKDPWPAVVNTGHIKHLDDICGGDRSINTKGDVFTGELIDHVADLYRAPMPVGVELEIQRPHITRMLCRFNARLMRVLE